MSHWRLVVFRLIPVWALCVALGIGAVFISIAGGNPWSGDNQRRVHRVVVKVLLAQQTMASFRQAVIAGKNDNRTIGLS